MKTTMKKMSKMLLAVSLVLAGTISYAQKATSFCNDRAQIVVNKLNVGGQNLNVKYDVIFTPNIVKAGKCESEAILVTPAIINEKTGEKKVLEVIVVNDSQRGAMNAWLEERCRACSDNIKVFTLPENKSLTVSSEYTVPYEKWMDKDTYLMVTTQKMYYPECLIRLCGPEKITSIANPVVPNWAKIIPVGEKNPMRDIKTRLYFPVNIAKSVETYFQNADALSLLSTLNTPNFEVSKIKIDGWASPEASMAYNKNLSVNRANTMKKIITDKYDFPEEVYLVSGNGEYWDDVITFIQTSDNATILASKEKLMKFVEETANMNDLDKKEMMLKKIDGGKPYQVIFKEVYPKSRFTDCLVSYKAKAFNKEEVEALYRSNPDQVTEEYYIGLLVSDNKVNTAILSDALKYYPQSEGINAIAGDLAVANGDIDTAIAYYEKAGSAEEVYNNLACCWMIKGNAEKAQSFLNKAKSLKQYNANNEEIKKLR